jgi:thiol:disulfide interchange protein DsbD
MSRQIAFPARRAMSRRAAALTLIALLAGPQLSHGAPSAPEGAYAEGAPDEGNPRVEARLLIDAAEAAPGEPVRLGVHFDLDRGWHLYWRNPGQAGLPTQLEWQVEGARVGPVQWPAPRAFEESDGAITTYGYTGEVLLWSESVFEPGAPVERAVGVEADFLVCRVRCIPGRVALRRVLRVGSESRPPDSRTRALFDRFAEQLPVSPAELGLELDALYSQSAIRPGDSFRAAIAVIACSDRYSDTKECHRQRPGGRSPADQFIPERSPGIEILATGSRPHPFSPESFLVTLEGDAERDAPVDADRLRGVLPVRGPDGGLAHLQVDLPLPRAAAGEEVTKLDNPWLDPVASGADGVPLGRALLFALLGGVILNLMPCVLPVLAIKVFGITEIAHRRRREVVANGLAYTAGILVTMTLLAISVAALRSAGASVGWGFQFQEPLFVAAISTVLLVFALNLFGVFEIHFTGGSLSQLGTRSTGNRRSFFEGLLAVVVATPCSAPFLGTAVGFAFASSTPVIVAIFLAIGLGLAAPYVLVTLVPGWARIVPRPGAWMLHLQRGLGFALIGTIVWLLWVIGRSVGIDGMTALLVFLVAVAFATWVYGALQQAGRGRLALGAGVGLAALAVAGLARLPLEAPAAEGGATGANGVGARSFDPASISAELEQGRPVFVYFTADWCLTCKVNERVVLADRRVQEELERLDVATFKADWTRRDEAIRAELARFGRAGVPMYLLYPPDAPASPRQLPELLTVDLLVEALRQAAAGDGGQT